MKETSYSQGVAKASKKSKEVSTYSNLLKSFSGNFGRGFIRVRERATKCNWTSPLCYGSGGSLLPSSFVELKQKKVI